MISNDERREVASRLRFTDHNLTWSEGCFCIAEDVGAAPTGNEHDDVLAFAHALADLIEPEPERTCNAEQIPYMPGCYEGNWCSVCHCIDFESDEPNYCPQCGAKVVE